MDGTALIEKAIEKSRIFGPAIAFRYAGEPAEQMWLWVDGSPGILPEDPIIDLYVRVDFAAGTLTLCDDQYQPVVPEAQMELDAAFGQLHFR